MQNRGPICSWHHIVSTQAANETRDESILLREVCRQMDGFENLLLLRRRLDGLGSKMLSIYLRVEH